MGNIRQAKKNRSSAPKQKPKRSGMLKSGKKKINVLGNAIIAENWDRHATLTQNYRRLGLMHRLNAPTGGSERRKTENGVEEIQQDSLHIKGSVDSLVKNSAFGETTVERDPETGKIIRVVRKEQEEIEVAGRKHRRSNPLNDPLNDLSGDEDEDKPQGKASTNNIVKQLEAQAAMEAPKKPRHQSKREDEWITRLVEKHGENYAAMARDRKLNPMQQTPGDLKRRINKWKATQA
ncbi:ribosome biogenesis protein Nop16 [Aspergillus karnatakaensis]|uniref:nucleolar protein 16 n=1 Tax=Aspergillus karnatakaensis TaxID=1810916 RepID=UPI003CCDA7CE